MDRCPRCSELFTKKTGDGTRLPAITPAGPGCTGCVQLPNNTTVAGPCPRGCGILIDLYGPTSTVTMVGSCCAPGAAA